LGKGERSISATSGDREFVTTRTFDAPRDLVWKAFSEAAHLMQWWGPKDFTMRVGTLDFRPGGLFHYCMTSPDGLEMWGVFVYREIVAPERIVFVSSFSDETGEPVRSPFSPTWPLEILNILTLTEHEGKTTLTLRGGPLNATEAERATFEAAHDSVRQGFTGTLDRLAAYLATM
jgi:uncharacterized protein YndB with AHSA1/START domain